MKAHTPGPWVAVDCTGDAFVIITAKEEHKSYPEEIVVSQGDGYGAYGGVYGKDNARLIAAAPELLEAVQSARSYMSHTDWCNETTNGVDGDCECGHALAIERVNAVIVKATGAV